jgi:hypothetical protein
MDDETLDQIVRELAEEIRTNTKLRHRLGMEEGSDSGRIDDEDSIGFTTKTGETFFIEVQRA